MKTLVQKNKHISCSYISSIPGDEIIHFITTHEHGKVEMKGQALDHLKLLIITRVPV
jgi:hypothetical protein